MIAISTRLIHSASFHDESLITNNNKNVSDKDLPDLKNVLKYSPVEQTSTLLKRDIVYDKTNIKKDLNVEKDKIKQDNNNNNNNNNQKSNGNVNIKQKVIQKPSNLKKTKDGVTTIHFACSFKNHVVLHDVNEKKPRGYEYDNYQTTEIFKKEKIINEKKNSTLAHMIDEMQLIGERRSIDDKGGNGPVILLSVSIQPTQQQPLEQKLNLQVKAKTQVKDVILAILRRYQELKKTPPLMYEDPRYYALRMIDDGEVDEMDLGSTRYIYSFNCRNVALCTLSETKRKDVSKDKTYRQNNINTLEDVSLGGWQKTDPTKMFFRVHIPDKDKSMIISAKKNTKTLRDLLKQTSKGSDEFKGYKFHMIKNKDHKNPIGYPEPLDMDKLLTEVPSSLMLQKFTVDGYSEYQVNKINNNHKRKPQTLGMTYDKLLKKKKKVLGKTVLEEICKISEIESITQIDQKIFQIKIKGNKATTKQYEAESSKECIQIVQKLEYYVKKAHKK